MRSIKKVIYDEAIPGLEALLNGLGISDLEWKAMPAEAIDAKQLFGADALFIRSQTKVTSEMIRGSSVGFVGSCTIGTDHVDLDALQQAGILFAHAPGCNARAVVEYVMATALHWTQEKQRLDDQLTLGIIGYGHIGRVLEQVFGIVTGQPLACRVYDPPLQHANDKREEPAVVRPLAGWRSLGEVLACDVVSVHVPLTDASQSKWPTRGFLGQKELGSLKDQCFINTARGEVVTSAGIKVASQHADIALDVFPSEPAVDPQLLASLWQATPHIAGYSARGKWGGTWQVFQQFSQWLLSESRAPESLNAPGDSDTPQFEALYSLWMEDTWGLSAWAQLANWVVSLEDLSAQMVSMGSSLPCSESIAQAFQNLRRNYKPRPEWFDVQLGAPLLTKDTRDQLRSAGLGKVLGVLEA